MRSSSELRSGKDLFGSLTPFPSSIEQLYYYFEAYRLRVYICGGAGVCLFLGMVEQSNLHSTSG